MIELVIQNKKVSAKKGQTILQAARDAGVYIPTMCYLSKCDPIGACRLCVVEIDGQNGEIAACQAKALDGMVVTVNNERLQEYRKDIMKLFCVNHPLECGVCDKSGECELQNKTLEMGIDTQNFSAKEQKRDVKNWGLISYDPSLCVLCEKCVHVCNEIIGDEAIKIKTGGYKSIIVPKNGETLDCTYCGECIAVCPVGALTSSGFKYSANAWDLEKIKSSCAHCTSVCGLYYEVKQNGNEQKIYRVTNDYENVTLCGAGRFGFDFENIAQKDKKVFDLALNAIKKADYIKFNGFITNEDAQILQSFKEKFGVKLINPLAYAFKTFIQNYAATSGNELYSATLDDVKNCDLAILFGSKISSDNPVVRYALTNASKKRGAKIAYLHPIEDYLLLSITDLFVKYEPSSEQAVSALLALNLCDKLKLNQKEAAYLGSLDDGFLSGEASFDETEQAKLTKLVMSAKNKILIVGADLYMHPMANLIAKLLGLIEKAGGFKTLMLAPQTNSLGVAMICDLDESANGFGVGYNEQADFTLSSLNAESLDVHLPMPALNQQCGSFFGIDKKLVEVNSALGYDGYTLDDLASAISLNIKQSKPIVSRLSEEVCFEEIEQVDEMNGALVYFCDDVLHFGANTHKSGNLPKTKDIISSAKAFAQAAKISGERELIMDEENKKLKIKFNPKMKGAIAIMSPIYPRYRFMPVTMREE